MHRRSLTGLRMHPRLCVPLLLVGLPAVGLSGADVAAAEETERVLHQFEKSVRPLLAAKCWKCHGPDRQEGGLRLDSSGGLAKGGESGAVVLPGEPDRSPLIQAVRRNGDLEMPPQEALSADEIAVLVAWVKSGARWPREVAGAQRGQDRGLFTESQKAFWSFQPLRDPTPPEVHLEDWVRSPIDRFVLARLERMRATPSEPADKRMLLRRVTFDLIGLPPSIDEIQAFCGDDSPDAFAKVVDRLLDSPHYGERWGRRWLDLVRYADTNGHGGNFVYPWSFRYRDYVVRAFNEDRPYDQFIIEQLAGDLLPPSGEPQRDVQRVIATGFLMLGPKGTANQDKQNMLMDIVDEQLDVTGRTFLGLTVSCARCHDHKFDPIPTQDYYSLAGIFRSTQSMADLGIPTSKWMDFPITQPGQDPMMVMAVKDGEPRDLRVHRRGSRFDLGKVAPRRFLRILAGEDHEPIRTEQSGRLELARWIASGENPLTARVMVNRIWQAHFRRGLVATVDNFGYLGEEPSHPRLLDWLASRFIDSGWSIKEMHRLLLNSSAYRMRSQPSGAATSATDDTGKQAYSRMISRRLTAEEIRDALLAISGRLDRTLGGTIFDYQLRYLDEVVDVKRGLYAINLGGKTYHPYFSSRRSVYLPVIRNGLPDVLQLFDFADPNAMTPQRSSTTVAPQGLFLMNSPFVREQAFHFARNLDAMTNRDHEFVQLARQSVLGRPVTGNEQREASRFFSNYLAGLRSAGRSEPFGFPHGSRLTLTIQRAFHGYRLGALPADERPLFERPNSIRLRLSATSVDRREAGRNRSHDWTVLDPIAASSGRGEEPTIQPGGWVRIAGSSATPDTYRIVVSTDLVPITALRLEIGPDPAEPPGRLKSDHFVLAELQVGASPLGGSRQDLFIPLQNATAKLPDQDLSFWAVIDGDTETNWPIGPENDATHAVILETQDGRLAARQSYCQALFCLSEFLYLD